MKTMASGFRQQARLAWRRGVVYGLALAAAGWAAAIQGAAHGDPYEIHLQEPHEGGMPARPIITSIRTTTNNQVVVTWRGFVDPVTPFLLQGNRGLRSNGWQTLATTYGFSATVPLGDNATFRVAGPSPVFAGSTECSACHRSAHGGWLQTRHGNALASLKRINMHNNSRCLPCHTVGYGLPTGYKSEALTPDLANVGCESCHGPAAAHAANPFDPTTRPVKELASQLCGGCHTDAHHPTFNEWETHLHAEVNEELVAGFLGTEATSLGRMNSCGACHSGSVRYAMLKEPATTNALSTLMTNVFRLPPGVSAGREAAAIGITCVVCHDPHSKTQYGYMLRYPLFSTNAYNMVTSGTNLVQKGYNASVQVCGQCHNGRGADPYGTARAPHYSPQYNILVGNLGVVPTNAPVPMSPHWQLQKQCVDCHMQKVTVTNPTANNPNHTGHNFNPTQTFDKCRDCHTGQDDEWMELLIEFTQEVTRNKMAEVQSNLVLWARTKAPAALRNAGRVVQVVNGVRVTNSVPELAWEFNTPGSLSPAPAGALSWTGPTAAQQTNPTNGLPRAIMEARFNLYMVKQDGSYGVHNNAYTRYLLKVANDKVKAELAR
ncbi:MAG: ammonia-forming cytochrome c nitrite reductase subunit c552 [Verrucomicrobiae bacterium]|nr:ammonia-forming cytochrome c nitrite reductase subunit c552 [Verrucomicrobiae bacterium]